MHIFPYKPRSHKGGGAATDEEGAFTGALAKTIGRPFGSNISSLVNREPHVRGDPEDKDISNSCGSHKRMAVFSETMVGMYSLPRACKALRESGVINKSTTVLERVVRKRNSSVK